MTLGDFIFTLRDAKPQRFDAFLHAGLRNSELPDRFIFERTNRYENQDVWELKDGDIVLACIRCRAKEDVGKESPVIGTMTRSDDD